MRSVAIFSAMLLSSLGYAAPSRDLLQVRTIYLMPMGSGLDQYLAAQIVKTGRYEVVTDPQRADAVFTDRIGLHFEHAMEELYPSGPKKDDSESNAFAKPRDKVGGVARARGTVFLVDRSSRVVIWSTFVPANASNPKSVEKRAREIAGQLHKQVKAMVKNSGAPAEPALKP